MREVLPLEQAALAHQKTTVGEMGKIALVPSESQQPLGQSDH